MKQPAYQAFLKLDTGTHTACIRQLALSRDGSLLVSAGECTIRVWDVATRTLRRQLLGQASARSEEMFGNGNVMRFAITRDARHLVALKAWYERGLPGADGDRSTELQVFELASGNLRSRFALPGMVDELDISPDGRWLLLAGTQRERRSRHAWVGVYATASIVRAGFPAEAPAPQASARLGRVPSQQELAVSARFVPEPARRGQPCRLVVALSGDANGDLLWLGFDPQQGMQVQREARSLGPLNPATLALSHAHAVVARADAPRQGRRRAGQLRWFHHDDGALQGALATDTVPASVAFSDGGCHLLVGLSPWQEDGALARDGHEMVAVHAYAATGQGFALQSSYFGHDGEVGALCLQGSQAISAGGDQHAIHFWDCSHRVGRQTAAIRGLGQSFYAPGINAREQVLFGTVPLRLLPPRQPARQQAFDLRRLVLCTTSQSEPTLNDFETAKWFIFDSGAQIIGLRHSPDARGAEMYKAPDLSLFVGSNDEWVIWTRSGYYAASPGGEKLMGYHISRGPQQEALFLSADRFKRFYRPDIVRAVVRHGSEARARQAGVTIRRLDVTAQLPPQLELRSQQREGNVLRLTVSARWAHPKAAPTRVWLLRNKRFVAAQTVTQAQYRFTLRLLPGTNDLTVLAENAKATSMPLQWQVEGPERLSAAHQLQADAGQLFLLAAGVSEIAVAGTELAQGYENLPFPHQDAIAMHNALALSLHHGRRVAKPKPRNKAFEAVHAALLVNQEASKAAILQALDGLCDRINARAQAEGAERDVLFVFLAGHGVRFPNDPELYFWNHDMVPETMHETGLSLVELGERVSNVPAEVIVVLDTCHSAMAGNNMLRAFSAEEIARRVQAVSERGMYVLSAARSEEESRDSHVAGQGVFTATLLEALQAERKAKGRQGVRMLAWMNRAQELLPQVMKRAGTTPQAPVLRMYGDLLPLTIFRP